MSSFKIRYANYVVVGLAIVCLCWAMLMSQTDGGYGIREDFNNDGQATTADIVAMLQLAMANRHNPRCDYNQDGSWSIADALSLMINVRNGRTSTYDPAVYTWSTMGFGGGGGLFLPTVDPHDPNHVARSQRQLGQLLPAPRSGKDPGTDGSCIDPL